MKLVISAYGARLTLEEKESATYGFAFKGDDITIRDIVTAEFDCYLARVGYHAGAPDLPDIWTLGASFAEQVGHRVVDFKGAQTQNGELA